MRQAVLESVRWAQRRARAEELREQWPFAAEVLSFYASLLDVQERTCVQTQDDPPRPEAVAGYVAERVLPRVVEISAASGPPGLMAAVLERFHEADFSDIVERWLRSGELSAVERFLARAAAGPVLEALGEAAGDACPGPRDERHCPVCGGPPQLSFFASSPENLTTAHRSLECARCAATWIFPRMTCAGCGENEAAKLAVYTEIGTSQSEVTGNVIKSGAAAAANARFPHLRIDGCRTCSHYLLNIDLDRNGRAVPVVDEIAAIPLDLYAKERGLTKIAPNLMGF